MHKTKRPYNLPKKLLCDPEEVRNGVSMELVNEYIQKHEEGLQRYRYLENLYNGFHDVYRQPDKEDWKPDNRLAVNFPRYITETFMGYGYGVPIKKDFGDDSINEAVTTFEDDNEITDHEFELFKKCCIYGHAFEYFYQDENTKTKMTVCTPAELFVVYDDTVKNRALFAVRYGYHSLESEENPGGKYGEILTRDQIERFDNEKKTESDPNPYGYINCVEYRLNDERMGIFENVSGLVESYNHAIGEKANDVDAFAEAYLAILGSEIDEDGVRRIRDDRIINVYGTDDAKDILVQFLQKPTADGTQENLLNRLENLIYQISMVANISDEAFGNASSGVSLAYKLQAMSNLALGFDRKIEKSLKKRYKIFCSLSTNVSDKEAWRNLKMTTTRNIPKNIADEAQTAASLEGIVSKETQLSVLSIVDNVQDEIDRMKQEEEEAQESIVERRMFGNHAEEAGGNSQSEVLEGEGRGTA